MNMIEYVYGSVLMQWGKKFTFSFMMNGKLELCEDFHMDKSVETMIWNIWQLNGGMISWTFNIVSVNPKL